ncbi:MAG: hypothetical protein J6Y13_09595 [Treponema sp.]|nr:hypothetical protein [Treponema sp.]
MPKVGDVFRTEDEYSSTGFDAKPRWFIYLGKVSTFQTPQNIFLCTTTMQDILESFRLDGIPTG